MSNAKEKLWSKDFIIMSIINFIILVIFYLLMVTIASFAVKDYHATTSQAGLVTGIYIIGTLIGRLATGRIIDQVGRKRILIIGLISFVVTMSLYFIHAGITVLLLCRFVNGISVGIASTATGTIVAQILPRSRKGEGIGYYSMSATLGTAIGPFIGILMSQHTSYNIIFSLCMILGVLCLVISFIAKVLPVPDAPESETAQKGFSISQYLEPKAIPIAIITVCMALGYAGILSFINFFAKERDLIAASSFFFVVYAIAILLTRPFSGRLMDTKGANYVMYPCFVLFGLGLLLLSTAHSSVVLLVSGAMIGIGYGNLSSAAQAIAVKLTPPHRMGLATSTYFIALDGGLGIGPYLLGFIIPLIGYGKLYVSLGIFIFITIAIYFVLHGRKDHLILEKNAV
ncbi:MFS transporter [Rummeliibacillus pycnus]|uniref:MFS transporter n=1 Tax=Rummeliibacillus pycnus TaxID=101070 RepID=UPI0037C66AC5